MTDYPKATILPFRDYHPKIDPSAFIAPGAVIIGDVIVGPNSSVWPCCVLRGDVAPIRIGENSNIQDGSVVHVTEGGQGIHVGDNVTVGHMSLLHDCSVEDGAFVGMRSTILDRARLEKGSMLAAGALLTQGKTVPTGQVWSGSPAKYWREITKVERVAFMASPRDYAKLASFYK